MKVNINREFTEQEREAITKHYRDQGRKGLPKLATRETMRGFVEEAIAERLAPRETDVASSAPAEIQQPVL